jgi:hypothetical protein
MQVAGPVGQAAAGFIIGFVPLFGIIVGVVIASAQHIVLMNKIGGNNGVDIHGVWGTHGVIITPRFSGLYEQLAEGATVGVAVFTIGEFLLKIAAQQPGLANTLGLATAGKIFELIGGGTPLGWAIVGALGLGIIELFLPEPDPDQHGGIHADRDAIGPWESFTMSFLEGENEVSLLSWQGFFSARDGGGGQVFANRPWVKEWERWTMIKNDDGTVSFKAFNGHFLVAEEGGGRECWANRTAIGPWEKFIMVPAPDGKIALKTLERQKFVSVQQDL